MTEKLKTDTFPKTICIDFETGEVWQTRAGGKLELITARQDRLRLEAAREEYAKLDGPSAKKDVLAAEIDYLIAKIRYRPTVDGEPCMSVDDMPEPVEIAEDDDTPVRTVAVIRADLPALWAETAKRIVLDGVEHYLVEGVELHEGDEEMVDGIALGIGDVPERLARHAAARGKTVGEVLADPEVVKVYRPDVETEEVWTYDPAQPLSHVVTQREPSSSSFDREFTPYAAVEAIVVAAVPPGTPISRARAGGDLGWRVGFGWMPVEGSDPSQPDRIRDLARSLAAIPGMKGEKPRQGDPELVAKVLAAGRAM